MKLKSRWDYAVSSPRLLSISEAIQATIHLNAGDRGGVTEQSLATSEALVQFLGALMERLYESKLLSKEELLQLLAGFEEVE